MVQRPGDCLVEFLHKKISYLGDKDGYIRNTANVSFMVFFDSDTQSPVCRNFCFLATCEPSLHAGLHLPLLQLQAEIVCDRGGS